MERPAKDDPALEFLGVPLPSAGDLTLRGLLRQAVLGWLRLGRLRRKRATPV